MSDVSSWREDTAALAEKKALGVESLIEGEYARAASLLREVYDDEAAALPAGDPELVDTKYRLAVALYDIGRLEEAKVLQFELLDDAIARGGPASDRALATFYPLALTLLGLGEIRRVKEIAGQLVDARMATEHVESPRTCRKLAFLTEVFVSSGDVVRGARLNRRVMRNCLCSRRTVPLFFACLAHEVIGLPVARLMLRVAPDFEAEMEAGYLEIFHREQRRRGIGSGWRPRR